MGEARGGRGSLFEKSSAKTSLILGPFSVRTLLGLLACKQPFVTN